VLAATNSRDWPHVATTTETSVNFYQTTRRSDPEGSHLQIRHREKRKSHMVFLVSVMTQGFPSRPDNSDATGPSAKVKFWRALISWLLNFNFFISFSKSEEHFNLHALGISRQGRVTLKF
jgi:hypothetical protein